MLSLSSYMFYTTNEISARNKALIWVFAGALHPPDYPCAPTVRVELEGHFVPHQDLYPVEPHFSGEVCKYRLSLFGLHPKESVWEGFIDDPLNDLRLLRFLHTR